MVWGTLWCGAHYGVGHIMVWGAFSGKGGRDGLWFMPASNMINAVVYQNILKEKLITFHEIQQVQYFQHDGAPCHTAKTVTKWLSNNNIPVIGPWPGSSPDLIPIENLWIQMKRKVACRNPTSVDHLKDLIKEVLVKETSLESCRALARSMPKRISTVDRKSVV